MSFLTDFADQAVILPLSLAVAMLLAMTGWWRGAMAWIFTVGGTLAVVGTLKLILSACGPIHLGDALNSPSGHTASATIVYGGLLGVALRRVYPAARRLPLLSTVAIAALIGLTRVVLRTHTVPDVLAGGLVGCAGTWALLALAGDPPPRLRPIRLAAVVVFVAVVTHGVHLRAEAGIQEFGRRLAWLVPGCDAASPPDQARP